MSFITPPGSHPLLPGSVKAAATKLETTVFQKTLPIPSGAYHSAVALLFFQADPACGLGTGEPPVYDGTLA